MLGPADQIVGAHAAIPAGQLIQGLGIIDLGVVNDQILDARLLIGGMVPGVEVLSPGGSPDGIGDIELMEHIYKEIAKEIEADLEATRVTGG